MTAVLVIVGSDFLGFVVVANAGGFKFGTLVSNLGLVEESQADRKITSSIKEEKQ